MVLMRRLVITGGMSRRVRRVLQAVLVPVLVVVMRTATVRISRFEMHVRDMHPTVAVRHVQPRRNMTERDHAAQQAGQEGSER